jgi:hypothetical protein
MKTKPTFRNYLAACACAIAFCFTVPGNSQSAGYNTAIGLRLGTDLGVTAKFGVGNGYIEGIVGSGYRALMLTVLYEKYLPAFGREDFHWYFGAGGHIGFLGHWYRRGYYYHGYYDKWGHYHEGPDYYYSTDYYREPSIGIDGIFGLEYKFKEIPFTASVDLKPFINIYRYDYGFIEGAFSFRYVF